MNIKNLVKNMLPADIKKHYGLWKQKGRFERLRREILSYYQHQKSIDIKISEALEYLQNNTIRVFPYAFSNKYDSLNVDVIYDASCGMHYVLHHHHKLYFKKGWSKNHIQNYYRSLLCEQDPQSAHCYLNESFNASGNDIILDVGCAEGNFSLEHIHSVKKIVLVEQDKEWIEALTKTFEPFTDKAVIIKSFAGSVNDDHHITLDELYKKHAFSFLKIDVDGHERELFDGAISILENDAPLKIAMCTYHRQTDAETYSRILSRYGFDCSFSDGYMLFIYHKKQQPPYFRKGVLRAVRN